MPVHDGVLEVEPLEVSHGGRFDFFGETKVTAQLRDLAHIQLDQETLFISVEK